jgi:hypothetical protein
MTIDVKDAASVTRTLQTLLTPGPNTLANSWTFGYATDAPNLPVNSYTAASITNPTSTLTRMSNTAAYAALQLIASSTTAGSVVVPSFTLAQSAGLLSRVRLRTTSSAGTTAPPGWLGVNLSINLWSAAPTYTNGDGGVYAPATGSAGWLANFVVSLSVNVADGLVGAGGLTGANEAGLRVGGTAVFWDLQILSAATPLSGQLFILTPEPLN